MVMRISKFGFLMGFLTPFAAFAANEGVPTYYQNNNSLNVNQANYQEYQNQGYMNYVGQSGTSHVVGTRSYSYQVPRQQVMEYSAPTTVNGIAFAPENKTTVSADYTRRFADFQFKTGVNSILEWDDMILNEFNFGIKHEFSVRDFDLVAFGDFSYGTMSHGGLSMDYDLLPYDESVPDQGAFTVSIGEMSGDTSGFRIGLGANKMWNVGGWKLSPSIGYEVFQHDLQMSNHLYPNPGIYLPLLTDGGDYVYGDGNGNFYSIPKDMTNIPTDLYQVCMTPEDIKLVDTGGASGFFDLGNSLVTEDYTPGADDAGDIWGVGSGNCVIIGGDGVIEVPGTTHIYNTTWSGLYVGLEMEKQMTLADKLRFYVQFGLPSYYSEGIWPNRTDWQQNPSFTDEGSNGAYSYRAEIEYNYQMSDRMELTLKVDSHFFHVGEIPGKLYVAEYTSFQYDEFGQLVVDPNTGIPILATVPAQTLDISDSLTEANWQSFGLHLGVKYSF